MERMNTKSSGDQLGNRPLDWSPLVIHEMWVLEKFYQLKSAAGYERNCDFLMALLEEHEIQNGEEEAKEQLAVKQEMQQMPIHEFLQVEYKMEMCKKEDCLDQESSILQTINQVINLQSSPACNDQAGGDTQQQSPVKEDTAGAKVQKKKKRKAAKNMQDGKSSGEYSCYMCPLGVFHSPHEVTAHFQQYHPFEKPFKCVVCGDCFGGVAERSLHFKLYHDCFVICERCDKICYWQKDMDIHMKEYHGEEASFAKKKRGSKPSKRVNKTGRTLLRLIHHCHICSDDVPYTSKKALRMHFKQLHPGHRPIIRNFRYYCPLCDKFMVDNVKLLDHNQRFHSNGETFDCDKCPKKYTALASLNQHKSAHHDEGCKYTCELCGKRCLNSPLLREHLERHKGIEHPCPVCNKIFRTTLGLRNHVKLYHESPKSFSCEFCGNKYRTNADLKSHLKIHEVNRTRDFSCDQCTKTFLRKDHWRSHMKKHENIRSFTCEVCSKGFFLRKTLEEHFRKHTGERPYKCTVCPSDFSFSGALYKHAQLKHKGLKISIAKQQTVPENLSSNSSTYN